MMNQEEMDQLGAELAPKISADIGDDWHFALVLVPRDPRNQIKVLADMHPNMIQKVFKHLGDQLDDSLVNNININ